MSTGPESTKDLETSIGDVVRTGQIVTTAQWSVAAVVMTGSAISAGTAFGHFHEPFYMGFIIGLAVDAALASWLLISRKLRATGVKTAWGPALEAITAVMTLCLNSGASMLDKNYALAGAHAFLPIVLFVLSMAGGEAQHKLHGLLKQKEAAGAARKRQADDDERTHTERATREHHETTRTENNRRTAEANKAAKEAEAKTAASNASVTIEREKNETAATIEREKIVAATDSLRSCFAILMTFGARLENMQAIEEGANRRARDRLRRQVSSAGRQQHVGRSSAGRVGRSDRQASSAAPSKPGPAETVTVERLLEVARTDLPTARSLGRPKLSAWLSERLGGATVSGHKTQQVMDAIRPKNGAKNVIEFHSRAAGE